MPEVEAVSYEVEAASYQFAPPGLPRGACAYDAPDPPPVVLEGMDGLTYSFLEGEMLRRLKEVPDNSLDSCVTDAPYGLSEHSPSDVLKALTAWVNGQEYVHNKKGFMSKTWDSFVPGPAAWREVYRVLKPGAYMAVFAGSRTVDLMAIAIRLAGFDIRDTLEWIYGSGFPKSTNVSKAIDKKAGATREVIGTQTLTGNAGLSTQEKGGTFGVGVGTAPAVTVEITAPATEEAKQWEGYGTALKPSHEPIILARKPPTKGLGAVGQVLLTGTGAINVHGCRVLTGDELRAGGTKGKFYAGDREGASAGIFQGGTGNTYRQSEAGRWPPNVLMSHMDGCRLRGLKEVLCEIHELPDGTFRPPAPGETEQIEVWECAEGCLIGELNRQSGDVKPGGKVTGHEKSRTGTSGIYGQFGRVENTPYVDSGGAGRYFPTFGYGEGDESISLSFGPEDMEAITSALSVPDVPFLYSSKASKAERDAGLEHLEQKKASTMVGKELGNFSMPGTEKGGRRINAPREGEDAKWVMRANNHPTVKPVSVMRWLVRLVTPARGNCIDPFSGSGTTGVAGAYEGVSVICVDISRDYVEYGVGRTKHALSKIKASKNQLTLFGED